MNEPSMKQVWAGMAMMAMLRDQSYETLAEIAQDAWVMANMMEAEEDDRQNRRSVPEDLR